MARVKEGLHSRVQILNRCSSLNAPLARSFPAVLRSRTCMQRCVPHHVLSYITYSKGFSWTEGIKDRVNVDGARRIHKRCSQIPKTYVQILNVRITHYKAIVSPQARGNSFHSGPNKRMEGHGAECAVSGITIVFDRGYGKRCIGKLPDPATTCVQRAAR
jgi:hypothetical protein